MDKCLVEVQGQPVLEHTEKGPHSEDSGGVGKEWYGAQTWFWVLYKYPWLGGFFMNSGWTTGQGKATRVERQERILQERLAVADELFPKRYLSESSTNDSSKKNCHCTQETIHVISLKDLVNMRPTVAQ